jgi:CDP-diacylglycerol---serine O-phosphatidyltransferase
MTELEPNIPAGRSRGIYLLPNLFTTACLFSGFFAILTSMRGDFEAAAIAIFVAMIMDGLDGRVARLTHTQSDFGAEYDSLSDMVAFGLAPALVTYQWALTHFGKIGWAAAFIYTAATALRLARFNTQIGSADKRYFQGLPSPSAAAIVASAVWLATDYGYVGEEMAWEAAILLVLAGLLMVSNFRFHSFKQVDIRGRIPFLFAVVLMLIFALSVWKPPLLLFSGFAIYAISGPVLTLLQLRQRRAERLIAGRSANRV